MQLFYQTEIGAFLPRLFAARDLNPILESRLHQHHPNSYFHTVQVLMLALELGYQNQVDPGLMYPLGFGAALHDIGKGETDPEILAKPGELTEEERRIIELHPRKGYLLALEQGLVTTAGRIIAHHEYKGQSPYPRRGTDRRVSDRTAQDRRQPIPVAIQQLDQIIAVVDIAQALYSHRDYKEPWPPREIEDFLRAHFTGEAKYIDQVMERIMLAIFMETK